MSKRDKQVEYNSEPVMYCTRCYSLKIRYEESIDTDYCMDCGCSDIATTDIESWEELYSERYGHKYTTKNNDPSNSPIYKMGVEELKKKVFNSSELKNIIRNLYPSFPNGLSRADSVILLFDKLVKDNRLNDLRYLIFKNF